VNAKVIPFLADSLSLWQVDGTVEAGTLPVVAVVRAGDCVVLVERNTGDDAPWRWFVRWRNADMREERSRPCASLTGMLNAVRRALNVERGNALRVVANAAPAPSAEISSLARAGEG
jgi:hypothetical protein